MADAGTPGTPGASRVEMVQMVMPMHTNSLGSLFGGQMVAWIDMAASMAAIRHSHSYVVTVAIDQLTFQRPIREGMAVLLQAQVDWVGRTSLEVSVEVWSEQLLSGARELTNRAFLSFVAVDRDLRPIPVPALTLVTDQDRQAFSDAQKRRQVRLSQRKEGSK